MSWNAQINSDFWIDSYTAELDPIEKVLFVYLLTSPHGNISGIYQIPLRNIATDTGIEKEMVIKILARFQKDGKVLYRDGWVCLKNRIKFNKMDNTSIKKGVEKRIKNCPDFINEFLNLPITDDTLYTPCVFLDKDIDKDIDKDKDKDSTTEKEFFEKFNAKMPVKIAKLSDKRKKTLKERLKDEFFKDNWKKALDIVPTIPFLMGKNKTDWRADFDFFTRPDSVAKIIEGKYGQGEKPSEYACTEERLEEMLRRAKQ